jgi:dTDP-glucose 4,6-dehydratase
MNIQKVRDDLGWEPEISLEEGVRKTTTWYVENQDWVEKVRTKSEYQTWVKDNYQERDSK